MDMANVEEGRQLISRQSIPSEVRDIRRPYQQQLAVYFILNSTFFEKFAFLVRCYEEYEFRNVPLTPILKRKLCRKSFSNGMCDGVKFVG